MDETKYACKRCGYTTPIKSVFIKHLKRKMPCDPIFCNLPNKLLLEAYMRPPIEKKYQCPHCDKTYAQSQGRSRHVSKCPKRDQAPPPDTSAIMKQLQALQEEMRQLKAQKSSAKEHSIVINNHYNNSTTNTTNTTTNNMQLNSFGNENLKHLLDNKDFMNSVFINQPSSYKKLVKAMYFDQNHPENMTVRKKNIKLPYLQTFTSEVGWETKPEKEVIEDVVNASKNLIDEHVSDNEDQLINMLRNTDLFDRAVGCLRTLKDYMNNREYLTHKQLMKMKDVMRDVKLVIHDCSQLHKSASEDVLESYS